MPFWYQLGSILPPKSLQNPLKNAFQEASIFWSILTSIFQRFGVQLGAILDPKLALCWQPNRIKIAPEVSQDAPGSQNPPEPPLGFDFDWFLIDFWSIFDRFGWSIFKLFSIDSWSIFNWLLIIFWPILPIVWFVFYLLLKRSWKARPPKKTSSDFCQDKRGGGYAACCALDIYIYIYI